MWVLAEDLKAHREGVLAQGFWALAVYRFSHVRTKAKSSLIRKPWYVLNRLLQKIVEMTCGISIPETAQIGHRLNIEHFGNIIIHGGTTIGDDCLIRQGVTIGIRHRSDPRAPRIGNRVEIGAGAVILGNVMVGDDVIIGANAVVIQDVPSGVTVGGVPARIIGRKDQSI